MDQCMAVELVEDLVEDMKVGREDLGRLAGIIITVLDFFFFFSFLSFFLVPGVGLVGEGRQLIAAAYGVYQSSILRITYSVQA